MDANALMKNVLTKLDGRPRLLLHACCAPCASAVLEKLCNFFDITIFYFNPNILPKEEWEKRKNEFKKLKAICDFEFIAPEYDPSFFVSLARGLEKEKEGGSRCTKCIGARIKRTFDFAKENGFDFFCSTLSISPHKNANLINEIGFSLETEKTKYLPNDFKKENGFLRSCQLCKNLNIYRQTYCGCNLGN